MSGGANTALYVLSSTASPTNAQLAVEARLSAAGLTVTRIASSAAAPSDVNDYSIVVVSKTIDSNLTTGVGKYAAVRAPILWMHGAGSGAEDAIYDHYLVSATTTAVSSAATTNTVSTVHQSTGSLSTGSHTFSSISSGGTKYYYWPSSMLASAVVRLRDSVFGTDPVAWTFESGDALRVGTAPNRRMVMTWFGPFLEFATADATTALDGAIAWCLAGTAQPLSSPLELQWDHAYWCEGPEFQALYPPASGGGGLVVGPLSLNPPPISVARVGTWPDEVGTLDAVQATAANRPTFHPSGAAWNGKPYVDFPDPDTAGPSTAVGLRTATFTAVNQPIEIVVIGRQTATPAIGGFFFQGRNAGSQTLSIQAFTATQWTVFDGSQNAATGAILDTSAHVFDAKCNYPTVVDFIIDGTTQGTFVPLFPHAINQISIGMDSSGGLVYPQIVFVGVRMGALLSAGDRSTLRSWSSGYYATP